MRNVRPRLKLYLRASGEEGLFGDGTVQLLSAVRERGSIGDAARSLGRGYRKAWGDIRRAEAALGRTLVETSRGGPGGGSTVLTPFGRQLLAAWDGYREEVSSCMGKAYTLYLETLVEGDDDE
ncbi:MAG: LysR family transcriptional regulator [Candidatus Krumholzibacteriota bacterium]|nr:LysR family transcriptional regulator [Candidatus Krumholzibacteriota bacterium]